jgi:RNA polymerase sigma-70 factor (ECF subfamily)
LRSRVLLGCPGFATTEGVRIVTENGFLDLIRRVRAGDEGAATELVRRYEPIIRRAVRLQLRDPRLRRALDSQDICQSVLASFFVRAASGQYELDRPTQLLNLLIVMARNKLISQSRRPHVVRRDPEFLHVNPAAEQKLFSPSPSPSQQAAWRDLLHTFRRNLTEEERQLADRRSQNQQWASIAAEMGGNADALRKKLTRALDRVSRQMGLDDLHEE